MPHTGETDTNLMEKFIEAKPTGAANHMYCDEASYDVSQYDYS